MRNAKHKRIVTNEERRQSQIFLLVFFALLAAGGGVAGFWWFVAGWPNLIGVAVSVTCTFVLCVLVQLFRLYRMTLAVMGFGLFAAAALGAGAALFDKDVFNSLLAVMTHAFDWGLFLRDDFFRICYSNFIVGAGFGTLSLLLALAKVPAAPDSKK